MCEFISWIELDKEILYLNNDCLKEKKGRELKKYLGESYTEDIKGHGAIRWYFDIKDNRGINKESTSINPKDYPTVIVKDVKKDNFSLIGFNLNFLTNTAWEKYRVIKNTAWEKYEAITNTAWEKYEAITNTALEKYKAIKNPALEKYLAIKNTALEKYEAITNLAFWELFKIKKNRIKDWK